MLPVVKATFDLNAELYRAIKVEAARSDRSVKDIVEEALERWMEALEDAEDIAAADEAMAEYLRDGGGVSAEEVFAKLAAEHKAAYGSRE
jgi:predicted DNA-binding protein